MKQKPLTISYAPSATDSIFPLYAVHPNAAGAKVEGIQIANEDSSNTYRCTIARIEYSRRYPTDIKYFGDGSVRSQVWNYDGSAYNVILRNVNIPPSTALNVLRIPMYLNANDVLTLNPRSVGSGSSFKPTITVTEFYDDDADATGVVDIPSIHSKLKNGTY